MAYVILDAFCVFTQFDAIGQNVCDFLRMFRMKTTVIIKKEAREHVSYSVLVPKHCGKLKMAAMQSTYFKVSVRSKLTI